MTIEIKTEYKFTVNSKELRIIYRALDGLMRDAMKRSGPDPEIRQMLKEVELVSESLLSSEEIPPFLAEGKCH